MGEKTKDLDLELDAQGIFKDYPYQIRIPAQKLSQEESARIMSDAKTEIDNMLAASGGNCIRKNIEIKERYAQGQVKAEWEFLPHGYVGDDGSLFVREIPDEGICVTCNVFLECGGYEEIYRFSINLQKPEMTESESVLDKIEDEITQQVQGDDEIKLPDEIDGIKIRWSLPEEKIGGKVFLFEVMVAILLVLSKKEKCVAEKKRCEQQLKMDYPEIVNKLSILVGAGMNTRQAWKKIALHYQENVQSGINRKREGYEKILQIERLLEEGESEKAAYQKLGENTGLSEYRKLSLLLVQNLEKGSRHLSELLEQESIQAFEVRKKMARKLGEEAGTKLLFPLMIMMTIVIMIVVVPAIMSF